MELHYSDDQNLLFAMRVDKVIGKSMRPTSLRSFGTSLPALRIGNDSINTSIHFVNQFIAQTGLSLLIKHKAFIEVIFRLRKKPHFHEAFLLYFANTCSAGIATVRPAS